MEPNDERLPRVVELHTGEMGVLAILPAHRCTKCQRVMVRPEYLGPYNGDRSMPNHFTKEIAKLGVVVASTDVFLSSMCLDCVQKGLETFICDLCGEERSSDLVETSYGDPPGRLCTVCYETVPAKTWEEARTKLFTEHRYDLS